ncbi:MAG TPA: alcohol dehydrogenase [Desulfobacteraceae bacterium]|nr:alcohol dehydrogenase [Desulfobacteraceae bacterium]
MTPFNFISPSALIFGPDTIGSLPKRAAQFGTTLLLVTGSSSFSKSETWHALHAEFIRNRLKCHQVSIPGEPSPEDIDPVVHRFRHTDIGVVIAVGGGSVLDAGKAISAMLTQPGSVTDYLEGVGSRRHPGTKVPFIAVPTTSGTGSEATKNAVISRPGPDGFKKSLRHDNFVPEIAWVDPALTLSCPQAVTAACGMDALTQLIEAFVSVQASPMTDALCRSGLEGFGQALLTAALSDPGDLGARTRLSWGAYISGLALANAGLGAVHGFASVIGGKSTMSHGNVCGTLLAETTRAVIDRLSADGNTAGLKKYAQAARLLDLAGDTRTDISACTRLVDTLYQWTQTLSLPRLGAYGITRNHLPAMAEATGIKNTPVTLSKEVLENILAARL